MEVVEERTKNKVLLMMLFKYSASLRIMVLNRRALALRLDYLYHFPTLSINLKNDRSFWFFRSLVRLPTTWP